MQETFSNCKHFSRNGSKIVIVFKDTTAADKAFEQMWEKMERDPFYFL